MVIFCLPKKTIFRSLCNNMNTHKISDESGTYFCHKRRNSFGTDVASIPLNEIGSLKIRRRGGGDEGLLCGNSSQFNDYRGSQA